MKPQEPEIGGPEADVGQSPPAACPAASPVGHDADRDRSKAQENGGEPPASEVGDPLAEADDPRLVQAVREYVSATEAGQKPDRQQFLARHPAIAGPLAECLEALEFVNQVGPQLEQPAVTRAAPPACPSVPGDLATPLGDFRLLREIGRGGMGVVYEAEQLSLGRRIALKVLPFALTLDSRQLQRFKNEARAAAHLHHTNIVPIYSVGCERGVHFYAMQYIEGQPLSAVIAELRQLASKEALTGIPENQPTGPYIPSAGAGSLGPPEPTQSPDGERKPAPVGFGGPTERTVPRMTGTTLPSTSGRAFFQTVARFGLQAAEALDHAHQLGVVHRDIKPGNLLLDTTGHLWVTDFGLAQFQSDAALTMTGDLVGTLRYMSPEQALARRGLVDHRTDLYSLGATLYELLTLEPVFTGCDRQELLQHIAFDEPRLPRRLNRAIPVDLETIVLKAMAKRIEDRYATAQELADDLRRFQEQKPIRARRPTPWERAAKWSRRHRAFVASGIVLLLLLLVGFAISTVLIANEQANTKAAYDRLHEEQAQTKAAYEAEARQRALADANFQQARRMLDFFAQVVEEELADKPAAQDVRRKLLGAALDYYQYFIEQHQDEPSIRDELVASHLRVAQILREMGAKADALEAVEQARQLQAEQVRDNPTAERRKWLSAIEHDLRWLRDGGRLLLQPSVQKELKLSQDQVEQVTQFAEKRREVFGQLHDAGPEEWRSKLDTLTDQESTLIRQLGPEQKRRLEQIAWQQAGAGAFSDPKVVEALQLTPGQVDRIRAIQGQGRRGGPRGGPPRPGVRRPDGFRRGGDYRGAATEQVLQVLSTEQKETWAHLIGAPFKGEIRHGPPYDYGFGPPRNRRPGPGLGRPGE